MCVCCGLSNIHQLAHVDAHVHFARLSLPLLSLCHTHTHTNCRSYTRRKQGGSSLPRNVCVCELIIEVLSLSLYLSSSCLFCIYLLLFSVVLYQPSPLCNYLCVAIGLCASILPWENNVYMYSMEKHQHGFILTFNHLLSMPMQYPVAAALLQHM